jgi:aminopeptidase N
MNLEKKTAIYLKDYCPPAYWVDSIDLVFDLKETETSVEATLACHLNPSTPKAPLVLLGKKLTLQSIALNERLLENHEYEINTESLTIFEVPAVFSLNIKTIIYPDKNTELTGLYRSTGLFCTQCEAEGFRRITYFPDRPDVLSRFTTTIIADKKQYPVLLSNGNLISTKEINHTRHSVTWCDPFLKPCYLFALVAGDLVAIEDHFLTRSKRLVTLKIYVERENQDKCQHAMEALKKAMKWDEDTYDREYDLDIYMIVAVNDFNAGAMENKGLNIFNAKYILARPETATDDDYQAIDAVVGHEYFHNWSGNRVTCRDWFQLSLKEGLTVFREHQFSSDILKSSVSLIDNIRYLKTHQFSEDAGPMAHPVRPDTYLEINNFYTATVYEKGAELIRVLKTLIGWEKFKLGMDLYFKKYDGKAVTIDDFIDAHAKASGVDLSAFCLWYSQAGTPLVTVIEHYDAGQQNYSLTLKQTCAPTPGEPHKSPMVIPIVMNLLGTAGRHLLPQAEMIILDSAEKNVEFKAIVEKPTLSLLRGFSAPVRIAFNRQDEDLAFLLKHDDDPYSRWDASQRLSENLIWRLVDDKARGIEGNIPNSWLDAYRAVLLDETMDPALKAEIFSLPSLSLLLQQRDSIEIEWLYQARHLLRKTLATHLREHFCDHYERCQTPGKYDYTAEFSAKRRLKNLCLQYLMINADKTGLECVLNAWNNANNMTDALGALMAVVNYAGKERVILFNAFYEKWQDDALVLDKWFRVQAMSELPETLENVKVLTQHPAFDIANPNKVYSLIGAFTGANLYRFHAASGDGYQFLADSVLQLNALNPQVAARMARGFSTWQKLEPTRQQKAQEALHRILANPKLSKNVLEVISKCLAV